MLRESLQERLNSSLLIGDGAMATYLYQLGVSINQCVEELVLSNPKLISQVHRAYYDAGARAIVTNTYGAQRERLERYGLERKVTRINREAVRLAKESIGEDAYVLGSMGSICGGKILPLANDYYRDIFEEQVTPLLHTGVDGILLETFLDLQEIKLAVETIRSLSSVPLFAQLSLLDVHQTRDGHSLSEAFQVLAESNVSSVGLNCRQGPVEMLRSLENVVIPDNLFISAFPNAGRLGLTEGQIAYSSEPKYFAEIAPLLVKQGVRLLGGCCGTTPEHIRFIVKATQELKPIKRINPELKKVQLDIQEPHHQFNKPTIVEKVHGECTIICEYDTPKDLDIQPFLTGAVKLHEAGVDAITMADNSLATARMSNLALGAILQKKMGIEPIVHVTCRDRNLLGQQSHLMGLHALGMNQILIITGDPTRIGDLPGASSIYDLTSFELIRMVKQLNQGISFAGKRLKHKANFVVGTAFNPHVRHIEQAIVRLEKKIESGADFVMTQPVYDERAIVNVYEATKHLSIPVFIGIMPLTGYRNALFLHNEVPGIKIPSEILKIMEQINIPEEGRKTGVDLAKSWLDAAMRMFKGIYLITPFFHWKMTVELTHYIRQAKRLAEVGYKK